MVLSGDYLYAVHRTGIVVLDLSTPRQPAVAGMVVILQLTDAGDHASVDLAFAGTRAYLSFLPSSYYQAVASIFMTDVSDPFQPRLVAAVQTSIHAQ
ncbi:MAG: hypothetical protein QOF51_1920 [Chloroflexota bacterium]|jgi:hypothetical protein|nr:hypothetical protein [Chloroflexota bacterium]